jgi:hypothetical protein
MFDSLMFPVTLSVMTVLAGLLIYYNPQTRRAVLLRRVAFTAIGCSAIFMTLSTTIVDAKTGAFFALVFDPTGHWLIVPNPHGYYLGRLLPTVRAISLCAAFVCPLV